MQQSSCADVSWFRMVSDGENSEPKRNWNVGEKSKKSVYHEKNAETVGLGVGCLVGSGFAPIIIILHGLPLRYTGSKLALWRGGQCEKHQTDGSFWSLDNASDQKRRPTEPSAVTPLPQNIRGQKWVWAESQRTRNVQKEVKIRDSQLYESGELMRER